MQEIDYDVDLNFLKDPADIPNLHDLPSIDRSAKPALNNQKSLHMPKAFVYPSMPQHRTEPSTITDLQNRMKNVNISSNGGPLPSVNRGLKPSDTNGQTKQPLKNDKTLEAQEAQEINERLIKEAKEAKEQLKKHYEELEAVKVLCSYKWRTLYKNKNINIRLCR